MADNELCCNGTFYVTGRSFPMCPARTLSIDTPATTMCAELTMPLPLPLLVCLGTASFAEPPLGTYPSASLACRDISRNQFTKVEVASAPSLAKLYGPDTRRMRTGLAIARVISCCSGAHVRIHPLRRMSLIP